ncbi:MAG: S16 family serine protease, partial [Myxococcota bacterium]
RIGSEPMKKSDFHIHLPAGAIPKDGPSAGVAMFLALASLLLNRRVRHNVAVTGEISLRGLVLPVGGIKEKMLAARRAGITRVVIPQLNVGDLEELPRDVRSAMEILPVQTVDEVLDLALEGVEHELPTDLVHPTLHGGHLQPPAQH